MLRSVISQQRIPYTNQATALIDAVKAVGEQLIAANPVGTYIDLLVFVNYDLMVNFGLVVDENFILNLSQG